jgi:hypothetical protein
MCAEGIVLRDRDGLARRIQVEAETLLRTGPPPLAAAEIESFRYGITDTLDDFVGCEDPDEGMFIANLLAVRLADFVLALNCRWRGEGKWVTRALLRFDPDLSHRLTTALAAYYRQGEKGKLAQVVESILALVGGRLFEGYWSAGKRDDQ